MTATQIYDLSRALYGLYYLTAFWNNVPVKLINIKKYVNYNKSVTVQGRVIFNSEQNLLNIQCKDGNWISVEKIGVLNKKPMSAKDFSNGYIKKQTIDNRIFK